MQNLIRLALSRGWQPSAAGKLFFLVLDDERLRL
jgi:hypothetical protein